jgi:hypothetical protein
LAIDSFFSTTPDWRRQNVGRRLHRRDSIPPKKNTTFWNWITFSTIYQHSNPIEKIMGNCVNRYACHSPAALMRDYEPPDPMPDVTLRGSLEPSSPDGPRSPQLGSHFNQFPRFTALPEEAQSSVSRFLDVPSLKNVRLSGKDGAALSKSWWVGNADELARVLEKFIPMGIEGLTLDGWEFTDAHMQMLPPTLTRLKFLNQSSHRQITEAGFAHLRGMLLRDVDLRGFSGMNDACLAHLRGMPLENLFFSTINTVTDTGMENLRAMPLRRLSLSQNSRITDAGMACVSLRYLDRLNLQGCWGITDATLKGLSKASLRELELDFGPAITDEGIKSLRDSHIEFLGVTGCLELTPACFDDLYAMPSLKRLGMSHYDHISNEEIDALEARLLRKNPAFTFSSNL